MSPPIVSFIICIWIFVRIRYCSVKISKLIGIRYMKATNIDDIEHNGRVTARAEPEEFPSEGTHNVDELVACIDDLVQLVAFVVLNQLQVFSWLLLSAISKDAKNE
jgi:hypothetical protein